MAVAGVVAAKKKYPVAPRVPLKEAAVRFLEAVPSLLLIILVIGGIVAGYFTATEASAVAVLYTFVLAVLIYREVKWKEIPRLFLDASTTTAIVMLLIGVSMGMSWVISYLNIPQNVSAALLSASAGKVGVLLIINVFLLFIGTFMDMTPAVLIFTPIFLPVAVKLGVNPVHFGIIMTMNLCIGLCTPPVGNVLFVGCGIAGTRISKVIKPLLPFFLAMVATLLAVTFVPEISLTIPRLFGY
jgi:tripartite ATP-independent transporter DctM subunit